MEFSEHHLRVHKTARYYVLQPDNGQFDSVWFVIHGYKQLGKYFIQHFKPLAGQGVMVVAPEGLHRFYIEGYSGRVGASWMTSEDRETDIRDYVSYLETLYDALRQEIKDVPMHLLGFSQGGPTACRWLAATDAPIRSLMLYATVFPDDFDFLANRHKLELVKCLAAFGNRDRFAPEEVITKKMEWMRSKGIEPRLYRFEGEHEIRQEVLLWFREQLTDH